MAELSLDPNTQVESSQMRPEKITAADLQPRMLQKGDTEIVIQRHAEYIRDKSDPNAGSLTEHGREQAYTDATAFFQKQLEAIPANERDTVRIVVLASDTQYGPQGNKRSTETAEEVLHAAHEQGQLFGLKTDQFLNDSTKLHGEGGPRPTPILREPAMFEQSPEFVRFLEEKYGEVGGKSDFWKAFEGDWEQNTRESMGAEGPGELAGRLQKSIEIMARYAQFHHHNNPDSRLLIWATSHYDTISPFAKRMLDIDKDEFFGVDYGAGLVVRMGADGTADTLIAGKTVPVSIK